MPPRCGRTPCARSRSRSPAVSRPRRQRPPSTRRSPTDSGCYDHAGELEPRRVPDSVPRRRRGRPARRPRSSTARCCTACALLMRERPSWEASAGLGGAAWRAVSEAAPVRRALARCSRPSVTRSPSGSAPSERRSPGRGHTIPAAPGYNERLESFLLAAERISPHGAQARALRIRAEEGETMSQTNPAITPELSAERLRGTRSRETSGSS